MNQTPKSTGRPRKRIGLSELQVLVSLLVKFSRKNNGDSLTDIWKPKWWPSNIQFRYPIQRNKHVSLTMWRKELVEILTKYYYATRNNNAEHLNGGQLLNSSEFLWEIEGQIFGKKNNSAAAAVAVTKQYELRSANSQNISVSEKTLKMLMPRLEVRVINILETDEYRKIKENMERNRQKEFLRNFSLITIPEYDKLNLDARYTLRASTKIQSNSAQSSPKSQQSKTCGSAKESPLGRKEKGQKEKNDKKSAEWEKKKCELENTDKPDTLEEEMIVVDDEPIIEKSPEKVVPLQSEKKCQLENTSKPATLEEEMIVDDEPIIEETPENEVLPLQRADNNMSSSLVTIDLDELSLKARLYLKQCSPSYVKLNKCKNSKQIRRRRLKKQKLKAMMMNRRVLNPREARKICRLKINSSYRKRAKKNVNFY